MQEDVLKKYGLLPNIEFTAVKGKVDFGKTEIIELVGAADLVPISVRPWDYSGKTLSEPEQASFWRILNLNDSMRKSIRIDLDNRSFAIAFRIPNKNIACQDIAEDEGEKYDLFLTRNVPASALMPYTGLYRVLRPKTKTGLFDFRLEAPGGPWKDLLKFGFSLSTTVDGFEFVMRQNLMTKFVESDGEKKTVEFTAYYFTLKLPEELHALDLQVITNDTAEELEALPVKDITQHLSGEQRGSRFDGYDLCVVYAPKKKEFDRVFTLQARPKRIAVFKDIPLRPTG